MHKNFFRNIVLSMAARLEVNKLATKTKKATKKVATTKVTHATVRKTRTQKKKTVTKRTSRQKDSLIKEKVLQSAAKILVRVAAFSANAALYNKEVGKRLDKRAKEALQVVGELAQGVKQDIKEGVRAAEVAKRRKSLPKKTAPKKTSKAKK